MSSCTIPPFRIRPLDEIAARFRKNDQILSSSSFSIEIPPAAGVPHVEIRNLNHSPPLVILASCSPYGTEITRGAIESALACAHQGIVTRVVFIEDGVFTVSGRQDVTEGGPLLNLQETVEMTSDAGTLEYYASIPSLKLRGAVAGSPMGGVFPINSAELARIVLQAPPIQIRICSGYYFFNLEKIVKSSSMTIKSGNGPCGTHFFRPWKGLIRQDDKGRLPGVTGQERIPEMMRQGAGMMGHMGGGPMMHQAGPILKELVWDTLTEEQKKKIILRMMDEKIKMKEAFIQHMQFKVETFKMVRQMLEQGK